MDLLIVIGSVSSTPPRDCKRPPHRCSWELPPQESIGLLASRASMLHGKPRHPDPSNNRIYHLRRDRPPEAGFRAMEMRARADRHLLVAASS